MYVACEGRLIAVVPGDSADSAVKALRAHPVGAEAAVIGQVMWMAYLRGDLATLLELLPRSPDTWSVRRPIQRVMATFTAPVLLPPDQAHALVDEIVDEFERGVVPGRHLLAPLIALAPAAWGPGTNAAWP